MVKHILAVRRPPMIIWIERGMYYVAQALQVAQGRARADAAASARHAPPPRAYDWRTRSWGPPSAA